MNVSDTKVKLGPVLEEYRDFAKHIDPAVSWIDLQFDLLALPNAGSLSACCADILAAVSMLFA